MSEARSPKRVVVLGGGITGLVACHRLIAGARELGISLEVLLLEASDRFGGNIGTSRAGGCLLEHGPDCFLSIKHSGLALCRDLGIENEIIGTNPTHRQSFLLRGTSLLPVPQGFYLLAPSSIFPFLTTSIFSLAGKFRMGLDLVLPRRRGGGDEALGDFVRRRLGREALERMAQPMIAGIYSADPEKLSLEATMPQFLEMERDHRSIILALRDKIRNQKKIGGGSASGPRYGLFVTLRRGLGLLVDRLLEEIPAGSLKLAARAESVRREGDHWRVGVAGNEEVEAEGICVALPAGAAGALLEGVAPRIACHMRGILYGSVATLSLVFRKDQVAHPLDGMGFVVPAAEGRFITACSFSSTKFEARAPEGKVLLRAFIGGAHGEEALSLPDQVIIDRALADLCAVLDIRGEPEAVLLKRYADSMPQYLLGHLGRVRVIEEETAALPGIVVAGAAYRGVGIPDCADSAGRAANHLLEYLRELC